MHNIYIYILIAAAVSYAIRAMPMTLIRKPITNTFIRSFLYYVPYVTLAVMTFPAIIQSASNPLGGYIALAAGIFLSWKGCSLLTVSAVCCLCVFVFSFI